MAKRDNCPFHCIDDQCSMYDDMVYKKCDDCKSRTKKLRNEYRYQTNQGKIPR